MAPKRRLRRAEEVALATLESCRINLNVAGPLAPKKRLRRGQEVEVEVEVALPTLVHGPKKANRAGAVLLERPLGRTKAVKLRHHNGDHED